MSAAATFICIVGTRPEAIKMAPVILALRRTTWARVVVVATAQHREMLDEALVIFGITPDIDLDLMLPGQPLAALTSRMLVALDRIFRERDADAIIAQGDTSTVLAAAMAAFYARIPFIHVEAGLRTGDMGNPFPEEMNRVLTGRLSALHMAPTPGARAALLAEGIQAADIEVTGNTVIDALHMIVDQHLPADPDLPVGKSLILLTVHRRENFGAPLVEIFSAVRTLIAARPELHFVYPVHPNPAVRDAARSLLGNVDGVTLCDPLRYDRLVRLMQQCWLIMTDSGGIQEEAPALGKPVLVLRDETERPEAVAAGAAALVGPHRERIVNTVESLLTQPESYRAMCPGVSPYGDGRAAERIVSVLQRRFPR
ncbi:MAG: UDP-N-acetylglucosamine 2-epimerase (non-hydrolyzing) [Methylobacterium sp.]|nr:UDP-N-acetylglucosamine 2-epimerase (non-hydrolyzing) [Methylobacterium sp.]